MSIHEHVNIKTTFDQLVFPKQVKTAIDEILEDLKYKEALLENGLTVRNRILIHGPPGCGKTSIAHAFADKLKIKLYTATAIVESYQGASEKNVNEVFRFANTNRVVYLLDEFDSYATARSKSDSSAGLSNNRLVNTLLQALESVPPLGMIICCTNFIDHIDPAIVRRFDLVIELPQATREALKKIADMIVGGRFDISTESILDEANTPSDVVRVATAKLRRAIIDVEKNKIRSMTKQLNLSPEISKLAEGV